ADSRPRARRSNSAIPHQPWGWRVRDNEHTKPAERYRGQNRLVLYPFSKDSQFFYCCGGGRWVRLKHSNIRDLSLTQKSPATGGHHSLVTVWEVPSTGCRKARCSERYTSVDVMRRNTHAASSSR